MPVVGLVKSAISPLPGKQGTKKEAEARLFLFKYCIMIVYFVNVSW